MTFKATRLGDFDAVVLAAARIGIVKAKVIRRRRLHKWSAPVVGLFMHTKRVDRQMNKLQQAGELIWYVTEGKLTIVFPDEPAWVVHKGMAAIRNAMRRHRGLIP